MGFNIRERLFMNSNEPNELQVRLQYIQKKVQAIQGWTEDQAGATLYQLVRFYSPNLNIVELGSWKGRSTIWLGYGIKDKKEPGKVYAVDTWQGTPGEGAHSDLLKQYNQNQLFEEFQQNVKDNSLENIIVPLVGDTVDISKSWPRSKSIGLLHIDASHQYEDVKRDFEFWSPFLAPNGIIVFDDVPSWPGPTRLVTELPKWYKQAGVAPNKLYFIKTT